MDTSEVRTAVESVGWAISIERPAAVLRALEAIASAIEAQEEEMRSLRRVLDQRTEHLV